MIGFIAAVLFILSVVLSVMNGRIDEVSSSLLSGAGSAVELCLQICGTVCFFSGIFKVAEKAGLTAVLAKILRPIVRFIMPSAAAHKEAEEAVCMNISSNLLGLGNAATPFGIRAVDEMTKRGSLQKTDSSLAAFIVLNTSSISLVPTTVIAIRSAYGSASPFDIVPAVILTQTVACAVGILLVKVLYR